MRYLEVRRHTMRIKPNKHVSQAGVTLARRMGNTMGPFSRVITSNLPRAFETAIAMGYAVDEQMAELAAFDDDVDAELEKGADFAAFARAVKKGGAAARFARRQARLWRAIVQSLPEGGNALVVSHGEIIELGAIGCMPAAAHAAWGAPFDYCEGVCLNYHDGEFIKIDILRAA